MWVAKEITFSVDSSCLLGIGIGVHSEDHHKFGGENCFPLDNKCLDGSTKKFRFDTKRCNNNPRSFKLQLPSW